MRFVRRLFYQPKHAKAAGGDASIYRSLAPSLAGMALCTVCLCGTSWAWFTATATTSIQAIQTPEYHLTYQVGTDAKGTDLAADGASYMLTGGTTEITLKAAGTPGATGYCSITIGDKTYYTEQFFAGDEFIFTVNAAEGTEIKLTPKWGTYSGTANVVNKGTIGTSSNSSSGQDDKATENSAAVVNESPTTDSQETAAGSSDDGSDSSKTAGASTQQETSVTTTADSSTQQEATEATTNDASTQQEAVAAAIAGTSQEEETLSAGKVSQPTTEDVE